MNAYYMHITCADEVLNVLPIQSILMDQRRLCVVRRRMKGPYLHTHHEMYFGWELKNPDNFVEFLPCQAHETYSKRI